jgi:phosphoribosylglycinamide formyltransferase-1
MGNYWIPLFSHSGSEVAELVKEPTLIPYMIFSNQKKLEKVHDYIVDRTVFATHPQIMSVIKSIARLNPDSTFFITLNGYNRIIPVDILDIPNIKMFNVHPGDIIKYPELRGADPQQKALDLGLSSTGVVIHEVDEGVDTGKIIASETYEITNRELSTVISDLRHISIKMWINLLNSVMVENGETDETSYRI